MNNAGYFIGPPTKAAYQKAQSAELKRQMMLYSAEIFANKLEAFGMKSYHDEGLCWYKVVNGEVRYTTKGDANQTIDTNYVSIDKIEGKYCFKIPKVGTIIMFFQSKTGVVTFLIVLLLIYFLTDILSNKNIFGKKGKHSL